MDLTFDPSQGERFKGGTQRIKNLSEHWLSREVYCPSCGAESLRPYANNKPVADCYCDKCQADFELKSHRQMFGASVVDGAYATMIERLNSSRNPHLFLLHYSAALHAVVNLMVVPKYFFVPDMIMKRPPLAATARRAGWVGCRIMLSTIPQAGKIYLIQNGVARTQADVRGDWQRTVFLHDQKSNAAKGWLLNVMRCVERIGRPEFTLDDVYKFADEMSVLYPSNNHIRQKMRQQLQVLRDRGFLHFVGHGRYRLA
jgi:type II restriction enzyme